MRLLLAERMTQGMSYCQISVGCWSPIQVDAVEAMGECVSKSEGM